MQERVVPVPPAATPVTTTPEISRADATRGFLFALSAYVLWGIAPIYMKAVAHLPVMEVLAHRVVWSVPVAAILLLLLRRTADIRAAFRSPRTLLMATVTALCIGTNWGLFVWAIASGRAVETALGYYINPLVTVALGAALLGERLNRYQLVAIGFAVAAVAVLTIESGGLPWVSLYLAFSFAIYGYLRKTLPVGPSQGFFLEVLILAPLALAWIVWLQLSGQNHFTVSSPADFWLLMLAGPVSAIPLILFAFGAKRLRISTIGIMQYIAPTLIGLIAVFVFGEPFGPERMIAFALIWVALVLYTWSMLRESRKREA